MAIPMNVLHHQFERALHGGMQKNVKRQYHHPHHQPRLLLNCGVHSTKNDTSRFSNVSESNSPAVVSTSHHPPTYTHHTPMTDVHIHNKA